MRYVADVPDRGTLWVPLTQCAWCNRIKLGPLYIPWGQKIMKQWVVRLPMGPTLVVGSTHGVCPACAERICRRAVSERSERGVGLLEDAIQKTL